MASSSRTAATILLEALEPRFESGEAVGLGWRAVEWRRGCRWWPRLLLVRRGLRIATHELAVARLLLAGSAFEPRDELPVDQPLEGRLELGEVAEAVKALGALLELTGRLRAAEHEHGQELVSSGPSESTSSSRWRYFGARLPEPLARRAQRRRRRRPRPSRTVSSS